MTCSTRSADVLVRSRRSVPGRRRVVGGDAGRLRTRRPRSSRHRPLSQAPRSSAQFARTTLMRANADVAVRPLLALNENESAPMNPVFGVYRTCAEERSYETVVIRVLPSLRKPLWGSDTILYASGAVMPGVASASIGTSFVLMLPAAVVRTSRPRAAPARLSSTRP